MRLQVLVLLLVSAVLLTGCQGKKDDPATTNQPGAEVTDEALPKVVEKVPEQAPQNGPEQLDTRIQNAPRKVVLLVAKKRIPQWTRIKNPRDWFERREILESETPQGYTNEFADLQDRVVLLDIEPGRPITLIMLQDESKAGSEGMFMQKTRGLAINVNVASAVAGSIQPGSKVDIVHSTRSGSNAVAKMVLENVLVRAVDQQPVRPEDKAAMVPMTVTLQLTPEQSLKLSAYVTSGPLTLLPRPSGGASIIRGVRPQGTDKAKEPGQKSGTERSEVPKLAEGPDLAEIRKVFQQAISTASEIQEQNARDTVLAESAEAQAKAGDVNAALKTLESIPEAPGRFSPKDRVRFSIALAQTKAGDLEGALQTGKSCEQDFPDSPSAQQNKSALKEMAAVLARKGDFKGALNTATFIKNRLNKIGALTQIAVAQAKAGDRAGGESTLQQAIKLAEPFQAKDREEKSQAAVFIAAAQGRMGNPERAIQIIATTQETSSDVRVSKQTALKEIALALVEGGDVNGALRTLQGQMFEVPILLEIAEVDKAASQKVISHAVEVAKSVRNLDELGMAAAFQASDLAMVARAQARAGDLKGALSTASLIDKLINDQRQKTQPMGKDKVPFVFAGPSSLTFLCKIPALLEIATAQAKQGDRAASQATFNKALEAVRAEVGESLKNETLARIALAQASAGDVKEAAQTAAALDDDRDKALVLREIAVAHAELGDHAASRAAFQQAVRLASTRWPSALKEITAAQAKAGDVKSARETLSILSSPLQKSYALLGIAEGMLAKADQQQGRKAVPSLTNNQADQKRK
jgi:Flp pilus assembly protein CpaB